MKYKKNYVTQRNISHKHFIKLLCGIKINYVIAKLNFRILQALQNIQKILFELLELENVGVAVIH